MKSSTKKVRALNWKRFVEANVGFDKDGLAHCSKEYLVGLLKHGTSKAVAEGSLAIFRQGYEQGKEAALSLPTKPTRITKKK